MFSRQGLLLTWKEIKPYFIFSLMLFFAGLFVGGAPGSPAAWLEEQLKGVAQIAEKARSADNPEWMFFILIVANNVYKSILAMAFGVIGGILPIFMLVANGMILGYLLNGIAEQGENVWLIVVKSLLPHGVLELCAVFLACAFGIRFGVTLIRGIAGSAFGKSQPWQPFIRTAIGSVPGVILVTIMLVLAAVVESTITYWLVS